MRDYIDMFFPNSIIIVVLCETIYAESQCRVEGVISG